MRAHRCLSLSALIALASCGPVATLDRIQTWQAQGRMADIATEPVPSACASAPFRSEACPKIHAIRGGACLALARSETAPGSACPPATSSAATRWLECAVDSYGKAGLPERAPAEGANLSENHARALYCSARLRVLKGGAASEGAAMARQAGTELSGLPPNPERDHLAASSALFIAQQEQLPTAERCAAAREAVSLASRGLNGAVPTETNLANLLRATKNVAAQLATFIHCG